MAAHTADDFMNNANWVGRMKALFDLLDRNKNGTIESDDWTIWVDNINEMVKPDAKLIENLRKASSDAAAAMGILPGKKISQDEYIKNMAQMAVKENEKRNKGERTHTDILNDAWYDVVDTNHDGFVTLDEYRLVLKASNFGAESADETFRILDANKNGKIERKELTDHEFKYWYGLNDEGTKGMFGNKFKKYS